MRTLAISLTAWVLASVAEAQVGGSLALLQRLQIDPGTYQSPGIDLDLNTREIFLRPDVTDLEWTSNPLLIVSLEIQVSRDGGATWQHWVSATMQAGELGRDGTPGGIGIQLSSDDLGKPRKVRVVMGVSRRVRVGARLDWTGQ